MKNMRIYLAFIFATIVWALLIPVSKSMALEPSDREVANKVEIAGEPESTEQTHVHAGPSYDSLHGHLSPAEGGEVAGNPEDLTKYSIKLERTNDNIGISIHPKNPETPGCPQHDKIHIGSGDSHDFHPGCFPLHVYYSDDSGDIEYCGVHEGLNPPLDTAGNYTISLKEGTFGHKDVKCYDIK